MNRQSAQALKQEVLSQLASGDSAFRRVRPQGLALGESPSDALMAQALAMTGIGIGIAVRGQDDFGIAIRLRQETPHAGRIAERITELAGKEVDIRVVGKIRPRSHDATSHGAGFSRRPLVRGISVGHYQVTAGTLGAFVTIDGIPGTHILSNNHVLAASGAGAIGDPILQPGPFDGGIWGDHEIGRLSKAVSLRLGEANAVDAAAGLLNDDIGWELDGSLSVGGPPAEEGTAVEKIGRTTGYTRGMVTAFDLDFSLESDDGKLLSFSGQIEVGGANGNQPFSMPGDSGSIVCRQGTLESVGLLFAGSDSGDGHTGHQGLAYVNPIDPVVRLLNATLL
jgi:hypothetical protein